VLLLQVLLDQSALPLLHLLHLLWDHLLPQLLVWLQALRVLLMPLPLLLLLLQLLLLHLRLLLLQQQLLPLAQLLALLLWQVVRVAPA
jgi:hypothetical protein